MLTDAAAARRDEILGMLNDALRGPEADPALTRLLRHVAGCTIDSERRRHRPALIRFARQVEQWCLSRVPFSSTVRTVEEDCVVLEVDVPGRRGEDSPCRARITIELEV